MKIKLWLGALCLTSTLFAQTNDSTTLKHTKTLFGAIKPKISSVGFYVAPEFQSVTLLGNNAPTRALSGMIMLNEKLAFGVAAADSRRFEPKDLNNTDLRMRYSQFGGLVEYTFMPKRLVHFSVPLFIGAANATVDSLYGRRGDFGRDFKQGRNNHQPFLVIQPGLRAEMNLVKFAKLYVGASYRIATGSQVNYTTNGVKKSLSNTQLSGLTYSAGIKIGLFNLIKMKS